MFSTIAPIAFTVLTWWISTGFILWLINRPRDQHTLFAWASTVVAALALVGIVILRDETALLHVYLGFVLGLVSWGWHELLLLMGYVSGPRKTQCPEGIRGFDRFWAAAQTVLHHEAGIAIHAGILTILSLGAENMVAALTFYVLWLMRISAKLLVFFGAPNIADHFLPDHLRYLSSYFAKTPHKLAAVLAVTATSLVTLSLAMMAHAVEPGGFAHAAFMMLTTLAALAVFEHIALVVRVPDQALWSWALPSPPSPPTSKLSSGSTSP